MSVPMGLFPITPGVALTQRAYGLYFVGDGNVTFTDGDDADQQTITALPVKDSATLWCEVVAVAAFTGTAVFGYKRPRSHR